MKYNFIVTLRLISSSVYFCAFFMKSINFRVTKFVESKENEIIINCFQM